jgi:uncharacterized protein
MDPIKIDISIVARDLKLPPQNVEQAIELLDNGNTIPFVTRFRKDLTGGLNEGQLLAIKKGVAQLRALAERKTTILKTIESQGGLTDELKTLIQKTSSSRRLEDLYLPFKTKKQSKASVARQLGLAPLADEILNSEAQIDFAARATDFVRVDKGLNTVDDVIKGVGDLLSEKFCENETLRNALRVLFRDTAKLSSLAIETVTPETATPAKPAPTADTKEAPAAEKTADAAEKSPAAEAPKDDEKLEAPKPATEASSTPAVEAATQVSDTPAADAPAGASSKASDDAPADPAKATAASMPAAEPKPAKSKKKKKKKKQPNPFKDYITFEQPINKLPHYRTLAINRGERAGKLKVKLVIDNEAAQKLAFENLVPENHPSADFLKKCATDSLSRSLLPSIEREIRREITESAERHAVEVFASNLRNLLLQPPTRNKTIMAIDPGYKRGCSVAVVDPCGNLIDSGQVFVVGNQQRRDESKTRIRDWAIKHSVDIIAIGNGTACREVEQMVSDTIGEHLAEHQVQYSIVNEAGASIYSTSEAGREEMPDLSPAVRSAVSIGRRLQNPLSELVKIAPANIGVGLYQHDIKAKHLSESLDDVVEFCVNQVGVDVNTASPALLKYVSGLNALAARRVVEHRTANGRFSDRQQLKQVSGVGDATFVQAAGFLRIHGGDNPLDATAIHPESYDIANDILSKVAAKVEEIFPRWLMQPSQEEISRAQPPKPAVEAPAFGEPASATPDSAPPEASDGDEKSAEPVAADANELKTESTETPSAENVAPVTAAMPAADGEESPTTAVSEASVKSEAKTEAATSNHVSNHASNRREFDNRRKEIIKQLAELDISQIASQHGAGSLAVNDIVMTLKRPAWDPRDKIQKPIFRRGIVKVDDLKPEMRLEAQVVNVVDFGVFVDIGLGESSLVHVSQLSSHYIADPHKVFSVGDALKVWVSEINSEQRRVKLTAIRPGVKKPSRRRPNRKPNNDRAGKPQSATTESGKPTENRDSSRGGGKPGKYGGGGGRPSRGPRQETKFKRPPRRSKPKPAKPITDKMLAGDEPMRSFSDLVQFVNKKPDKKSKSDKGEGDKTT